MASPLLFCGHRLLLRLSGRSEDRHDTDHATEAAIVNAMTAAEPMEGANRFYVAALPIDRACTILTEHDLLKTRTVP